MPFYDTQKVARRTDVAASTVKLRARLGGDSPDFYLTIL